MLLPYRWYYLVSALHDFLFSPLYTQLGISTLVSTRSSTTLASLYICCLCSYSPSFCFVNFFIYISKITLLSNLPIFLAAFTAFCPCEHVCLEKDGAPIYFNWGCSAVIQVNRSRKTWDVDAHRWRIWKFLAIQQIWPTMLESERWFSFDRFVEYQLSLWNLNT